MTSCFYSILTDGYETAGNPTPGPRTATGPDPGFDAALRTNLVQPPHLPRPGRWTSRGSLGMVCPMIDPKLLDDLARRMAGSIPTGLQSLQQDLQKSLRSALESGLSHLDLVTREEFDVQTAVLARTREKLERLERQVAELERQAGMNPEGSPEKN